MNKIDSSNINQTPNNLELINSENVKSSENLFDKHKKSNNLDVEERGSIVIKESNVSDSQLNSKVAEFANPRINCEINKKLDTPVNFKNRNKSNFEKVLQLGLKTEDLSIKIDCLKYFLPQARISSDKDFKVKIIFSSEIEFLEEASILLNSIQNFEIELFRINSTESQEKLKDLISQFGDRVVSARGYLPLSLALKLTNLKSLYLDMINPDLEEISNLKNLETFEFNDYYKSNGELILSDMPNLINFTISSSTIKSFNFNNLPNLQKLKVQCQLTIPPVLNNLPRLESLDLSRCRQLTTPPVLNNLPTLESLDLSYCRQLTTPPDISQCPGLKSLNLNYTGVTFLPESIHNPNLQIMAKECFNLNPDPELVARSEGLYFCSDKILDEESGGYLYRIKMHQLDNSELKDIGTKIFPANQYENYEVKLIPQAEFEFLGFKKELNERNNPCSLILPDATVLNYKWEKLRQQYPSLPDFTFVSSDGIIDDRSFVHAFLNNQLILSRDKEFIHDSTGHIIPELSLALKAVMSGQSESSDYYAVINRYKLIVKSLSSHVDVLEETLGSEHETLVKVLRTYVGMVVDIFTIDNDLEKLSRSLALEPSSGISPIAIMTISRIAIMTGGSHPRWRQYMINKYGEEYERSLNTYKKAWDYLLSKIDTPSSFSKESFLEAIQ